MKNYKHIVCFAVCLNFLALCMDLDCSHASTMKQNIHLLLTKAEKYSKQQGKHDLAIMICNKAIKLQPGNLESYYRRAVIYGRQGDYVNAIRDFSIVIKNDEKNKNRRYSKARKWRADCFMGLGFMQKAVDDYAVMIKRNPKSAGIGKIWFYMAEALALMGKNSLALTAIQRGCETGSHWCEKMKILQNKILLRKKIIPHKPLSN